MLMKKMRRLQVMAVAMLAMSTGAMAQDKVEATIQGDFVNQYIWRGQDLGSVSFQPSLGIAYKGLSLTAWGNVGLSEPKDTKELDLTAAYAIKGFHVGVTDYWFNTPNDRYFCYATHKTSHLFEANIGYDFSFLALNWYTNFAGNDTYDEKGNRDYSSYVEASVPFKFASCNWTATVGAVPYETTFYKDAGGFAVTNVSLRADKEIKITDSFSVPVFAGISANPSTEKAYLLFGFTLRP